MPGLRRGRCPGQAAGVPVSYTHLLTIPQDRIIIVDPMGEYAPLVRRLGGQAVSYTHLDVYKRQLHRLPGALSC